jgi:hypothetical protein
MSEEGEENVTKVQLVPAQHFTAIVVGVKIHVERIDIAVAFVIDDDCCGDCTVRLAIRVWFGAFDPLWILGYVVVGSEVHITTKLVDVVLSKWLGWARDFIKVYSRSRVVEKGLDISRHILIIGVKIDDRCWAMSATFQTLFADFRVARKYATENGR